MCPRFCLTEFSLLATPTWPVAKKLPVMFWIHGGANYNGSGRLSGVQTLTFVMA